MKTYENLKRSYGKYLNMDFYVYEPVLVKEKNKYKIVEESIIEANKDSRCVERNNGGYYVSASDIDKLVIPDDTYNNLLLKALAFNLNYYAMPHFDEIYATASKADLTGTVRQLMDSAGKLLLQYCDKQNKLIKFTDKDYKTVGNYIGRFCSFSNLYIYKTVYTMGRLILEVKDMMNGELRTLEPVIKKAQLKNTNTPICIVNDTSIIKKNLDCVALKKNEQYYYISPRSLDELIIPKEDYNMLGNRMIVRNLDRMGIKKLPAEKMSILKYAIENHFDKAELLASHWLINTCRQNGMFANQSEDFLKALANYFAEYGDFPKKCAELISASDITKEEKYENIAQSTKPKNRNQKISEQYYSKETEIRSFKTLIDECRIYLNWKDPIIYTPLLVEVKRLFKKSDIYTIKDEQIIKANCMLDRISVNGKKYQIKKDDIAWLIIPDSIYDDLLLKLLISNIDHFGELLFERDKDWILESAGFCCNTLEAFAEWLLNTLRSKGLIDGIPSSLYQEIYKGLKKGSFASRSLDAYYRKNDKEDKEEREEEKRLLEEEKIEEELRDWWYD